MDQIKNVCLAVITLCVVWATIVYTIATRFEWSPGNVGATIIRHDTWSGESEVFIANGELKRYELWGP